MWTDNETSLDLLGFQVHADLIRSVVTDPKLLPVTIGVFADWGGGKTSLMKMLEESFEPKHCEEGSDDYKQCERIACLYFNGWLFEGYDDAKSAILSSVLVALGEHKRFDPKMRDKCASLLKSVNWMRVAHLGLKNVALPAIAAYATGGASLASSFGKLLPWGKTDTEQAEDKKPKKEDTEDKGNSVDWASLIEKDQSDAGPLDVRTFREKFGQLLKDSSIDSLIVLIDDLDRCSPERIIENLEAIKLFLNVENTAFIIGADPRIVRHAIAWKYKDHDDKVEVEDEAPTIVTDYLEKLIQYPYRLPRLSPAEIETYMALLFCQSHLSDEIFLSVVSACNSQRVNDRYSVFGYSAVKDAITKNNGERLPEELDSALAFSASAAPLITECLKGNPRQVKRFLNAFVLRKKLAQVANLTNIQDNVLVKLMILEYSHEERFRELYEWQAAQNGIPEQITELEKNVSGDEEKTDGKQEKRKNQLKPSEDWETKESLKRWVKMEPRLSGIDLRDYFWIARDRLQSITGMSMVPPILRRMFEGLIGNSPSAKEAALKSIADSNESELEILYELLRQNAKQNPTEKSSYDAYRSLIENNVNGADRQMAATVSEIPETVIPPAVGGDIVTLTETKPETTSAFSNILTTWKRSDTQVGKMVTEAITE